MNRPFVIAVLTFLPLSVLAASPSETGWEGVDKTLGVSGKDLPGEVRRYGWPRADLHVTVGGVPVEPALALGAWAAFLKTTTAGMPS
jgi:Domain of Unknown Function (DUF1259)